MRTGRRARAGRGARARAGGAAGSGLGGERGAGAGSAPPAPLPLDEGGCASPARRAQGMRAAGSRRAAAPGERERW